MSAHIIRSKRLLAEKVHEFWVEAPLIARKRKAGQFVIVRMNDRGERIPLTIKRRHIRPDSDTVTIE
jgi:NAD(P)H-flavin reductase